MNEIGLQMMTRLQQALPEARVYWEREPDGELHGSVLSAEFKHRKFTIHFESGNSAADPEENPDYSLVEQVVDDFVDFFARSIYPKEKFTRII